MKRCYRYKYFFNVILLACVLLIKPGLSYGQDKDGFFPAAARDISDRKYESAVIELLDGAKKSIVISMYIIQVEDKGPVRLLMKDLEEALDRGVTVEIYLNTKFTNGRAANVGTGEAFDAFRQKRGRIYYVTPSTRMHDKLIIVDERYVVLGSANWSVASLKDNYESSTLVDSPGFAAMELVRLRRHTLEGDEPVKPMDERKVKRPIILKEDVMVSLSDELLNNRELFSRMVTESDDRAMDMYLLLIAYSIEQNKDDYLLSLEQLAADMGMPSDWSDTALRRQVIKTLKKLKDRYKLINVDFGHGKDAWVTLKKLPGQKFEFQGKFLNPDYLSKLTLPAKFILLVNALLEKEGAKINSFTQEALGNRFGISSDTVGKGLKDLESHSISRKGII